MKRFIFIGTVLILFFTRAFSLPVLERNSICVAQQTQFTGSLSGLCHLAEWYQKGGKLSTAIKYFQDALHMEDSLGNHNPDICFRCQKGMGECYFNLNNLKSAAHCFESAVGLFDKLADEKDQNECLYLFITLSDTYCTLGNWENAKNSINQLWELTRSTPENTEIILLYAIGNFYYQSEQYESAVPYLNDAFLNDQAPGQRMDASHLNVARLANSYFFLGEYHKALIYYKILDKELPNIFTFSGREQLFFTETFENYAHCLFLDGSDKNRVENILHRTFENRKTAIMNNMGTMSEAERKTLYESLDVNVSHYIDYYEAGCRNIPYILYNLSLLRKGLLLSLSIETKKLVLETQNAQLESKYNRMLQIKQETDFLLQQGKSNWIEDLVNESETIERDLAFELDKTFDITKNLSISCSDIRDKLGTNDIAIEFIDYYSNQVRYYAGLVMMKDRFPMLVQIADQNELLLHQTSNFNCYNDTSLCKLIWDKILSLTEITSEGNIYFSAVGDLHKIEIEYLMCPDGLRMNEKFVIHRLSSTRSICARETTSPSKRALLFGGIQYNDPSIKYLPYSKIEVENVSSLLKMHAYPYSLFTGDACSESSFKAICEDKYSFIHIATHGYFRGGHNSKKEVLDNPVVFRSNSEQAQTNNYFFSSRAGLLFSDVTKLSLSTNDVFADNGVLTEKEVACLNLFGTDLIVLSACQTALADYEGEELFGLQRGFKQAGAQTLVLSLSNVDDEATSFFMTSFYDSYLSGMSKQQAFSTAQTITRKKFPNPKFWAPFILID